MCGITGIVNKNPLKPVGQKLLTQMTDSIAHRGPDGEGFYYNGGVGLGHRRLAIIDIAGSPQPMKSLDEGCVITYNGEVYNYQKLRTELIALGHKFQTDGDTEVVLNAYKAWGEGCVNHLRGMFAFAIWDNAQQKLFIARDRLGIKPVHYRITSDGALQFASELKSLLCDQQLKRKVRVDALEDYLAFGYVPDPKVIIEGVQKLESAHYLVYHQGTGKVDIKCYWSPNMSIATEACDQGELLELLEQAVHMRMIADVPVGSFLSGGVDSSIVSALMMRHCKALETCAIGSTDPNYDESGYAQIVADHIGSSHSLDIASPKDEHTLNLLPDIFDEPFADASALPMYKVCALARRKVTVCLSGDGGDEVFAGYRRYQFHMAEEKIRAALPISVRGSIFGALGRFYPKMDWAPQFLRAKSTFENLSLSSARAYFNSVARVPDRDRYRILSPKMRKILKGYHPAERFDELASEIQGADPLSVVQYIDLKFTLPAGILTKVERTSMANSLEVRVPMLDHKFIEWALKTRAEFRMPNGQGKAPLKSLACNLVPSEVVNRPKKGFIVPISEWMKDELAGLTGALANDERLLDSGLFNADEIRQMASDHKKGLADHHTGLWSLLMLTRSAHNINLDLSAC